MARPDFYAKTTDVKTTPEVAKRLHELMLHDLLAAELYQVQAIVLRDWGFVRLADHFEHESLHEREHARWQLERLTYLEVPIDLSKRPAQGALGETPKQMLETSMSMELDVARKLRKLCTAATGVDEGTRTLAEKLLEETENDHILWLEQQLTLIEQVGLKHYLAQMSRPDDTEASSGE